MEYVQRSKYKFGHPHDYLYYDRVHLSDGEKTLCGKTLTEMWFITGDESKQRKTVTCSRCKRISERKAGI